MTPLLVAQLFTLHQEMCSIKTSFGTKDERGHEYDASPIGPL